MDDKRVAEKIDSFRRAAFTAEEMHGDIPAGIELGPFSSDDGVQGLLVVPAQVVSGFVDICDRTPGELLFSIGRFMHSVERLEMRLRLPGVPSGHEFNLT